MRTFKLYLKESFLHLWYAQQLDRSAAHIHDQLKEQNRDAGQDVLYEQLPETEKEKYRRNIQMIDGIVRNHGLNPSDPEQHDAIVDRFASDAHNQWKAGWESRYGVETPRPKLTDDGVWLKNTNVHWSDLHPDHQREYIETGKAALDAYNTHMSVSPFGHINFADQPMRQGPLSNPGAYEYLKQYLPTSE